MKLKKLFLTSIFVFALFIFCGIGANAANLVAEGSTYELSWVLDSDGKLTVTSNTSYPARMKDYGITSPAPWSDV